MTTGIDTALRVIEAASDEELRTIQGRVWARQRELTRSRRGMGAWDAAFAAMDWAGFSDQLRRLWNTEGRLLSTREFADSLVGVNNAAIQDVVLARFERVIQDAGFRFWVRGWAHLSWPEWDPVGGLKRTPLTPSGDGATMADTGASPAPASGQHPIP